MSTTQDSKKQPALTNVQESVEEVNNKTLHLVAVEEQNQGKDIRKIPTLMKIHHPSPPPPPPSNNKLKKFLKMNNV